MKILYISPENTAGTLNLWKKSHEDRGNECEFITLYPSAHSYESGICLDLPLIKSNTWYTKNREKYYKTIRSITNYQETESYPFTWKPNTYIEKKYFELRDWIWHFKIEPIIEKYKLLQYDIYHFEWGLDFYRDSRFAKKISQLGKSIVCTYHGEDLRTRGVIPQMDYLSQLNLTSELDLLYKHPKINYLFLPFNTSQYDENYLINSPIRVCHSPTNRFFKGSEDIITICKKLEKEGLIEFVLIEKQPHNLVIKQKQSCDILIDQIHNRGGWGYGMNSIEALSMGLCCLTELTPKYERFIPDHPFININLETLYSKLLDLINNKDKILSYKQKSRNWVIKFHNMHNVAEKLYQYYDRYHFI